MLTQQIKFNDHFWLCLDFIYRTKKVSERSQKLLTFLFIK